MKELWLTMNFGRTLKKQLEYIIHGVDISIKQEEKKQLKLEQVRDKS